MHLADAFIQSDLQCIHSGYTFVLSVCVYDVPTHYKDDDELHIQYMFFSDHDCVYNKAWSVTMYHITNICVNLSNILLMQINSN